VCLDSCHLLASGYDIRTAAGMSSTLRRRRASSDGTRSARCTQRLSDPARLKTATATPTSGAGELGEEGCMAFLSAPGLQKLPCVLETPGANREGPGRKEIALAIELRDRESLPDGVSQQRRSGGLSL